jgi:hypothetical protein
MKLFIHGFKNVHEGVIRKTDVAIAKNYLSELELE